MSTPALTTALAQDVLGAMKGAPRLNWLALIGWFAKNGSVALTIFHDVRNGVSLTALVARYGEEVRQAATELMGILGLPATALDDHLAASRAPGAPGTNFTLLVVLGGGTPAESITLVWPMEESSAKAVGNAFAPLAACTALAWGNDFGPAGPAGNFLVVKGVVNGIKATG